MRTEFYLKETTGCPWHGMSTYKNVKTPIGQGYNTEIEATAIKTLLIKRANKKGLNPQFIICKRSVNNAPSNFLKRLK